MAMLVADASHWQGENPPWSVLAAHPEMCGVILKATEGLNYAPDWFVAHWSRVRDVARLRYGDTWFRGAYHYLDVRADGAAQADFYLAHVKRAGGFGAGDMRPIVDVELGGRNAGATAPQVLAATYAFTRRMKEHGYDVILYGRGAMRDLGIADRMGCVAVWNPSYTRTMIMNGLTPAWSVDDVVLWQYTDGTAGDPPNGLPMRIPGWPEGLGLDLSVYVDGARRTNVGSFRRRVLGSLLDSLIVLAVLVVAAVAFAHSVA